MNIDEIKAAIQADKSSLEEAFEKTDLDKSNHAIREGWMAWEWMRRQLVDKGLSEDHARAMQSIYMGKVRNGFFGTYGAIRECLFGDQVTIIT